MGQTGRAPERASRRSPKVIFFSVLLKILILKNTKYLCRWGKRSEELEEGMDRFVRATPLRWGKRSVPEDVASRPWEKVMEELSKRAPLRWGKRSPSRFGKRSPSRFGKRGPSRFGKRGEIENEDLQILSSPWHPHYSPSSVLQFLEAENEE